MTSRRSWGCLCVLTRTWDCGPKRAIAEIGEEEFEFRCPGPLSSLAAFGRSEHLGDWQDLMSQYLVRRTRRFIMDRYARTDDEGRKYIEFSSGKPFHFPERIARPVERELSPDDPAAAMSSDDTLDDMKSLKLPRYSLGSFIGDDFEPADADERALVEDLRNSARGNLAGFTRITMFKRLSSSGPAFLATLNRHRMRNEVASYALTNGLPVPVGTVDNALWNAEDDTDTEDQDDDDVLRFTPQIPAADAYQQLVYANPSRIRWARSAMFDDELSDDLDHDTQVITTMLERFGRWDADGDGKLASLQELISQHQGDKISGVHRGRRHRHIRRGRTETTRRRRSGRCDRRLCGSDAHSAPILASLQTRPPPAATQTPTTGSPTTNYGCWCPQTSCRRGRTSRMLTSSSTTTCPGLSSNSCKGQAESTGSGQTAPKVLVYSLLPAGTVEKEIKLRSRIRDRLGENARLLGSDEKFFGDPTEQAVISGKYDTHPDDDPQDDVDPVSMAYEIWHHAEQHHPDAAQAARPATQRRLLNQDRQTRHPQRGCRPHPDRHRL